jgi:enterochelin esterase family protein
MHVYTPPGYDNATGASYPTLYLFHGSGDNDACWTELGRAHWILDNLISQGKARPMIVVMTDGHARLAEAVGTAAPEGANRNQVFEKDLLGEVVPFVESNYRVQADRLHRAIIGLSMGGGQSLGIGLNHLELFAWVGGMSSAMRDPQSALPQLFADPSRANADLRLLWVACGRDDRLVVRAREFSEILKSNGIRHEYVESAGGHAWGVWRKYLAEFAPLLFVEK